MIFIKKKTFNSGSLKMGVLIGDISFVSCIFIKKL